MTTQEIRDMLFVARQADAYTPGAGNWIRTAIRAALACQKIRTGAL